ncbi:hypothetical protein [Agrobacterium sp. NPDC090283]|uniref:hypothetical protein n=1 Tax=Agrobacterium sp. NPDC090283 TaxID=3363920 RepID=UPI00383B457B
MKPLHYDPWLIPLGPLEALSQQIFQSLPPPRITPGRKPRADAVARREAALKSILANLAALHLFPAPRSGVAMPLRNSKRTRYDRSGFTADVLRRSIGDLEGAGLVDVSSGEFKQKRTTVSPSIALRGMMVVAGITLEAIGRDKGQETIELWTRRQGRYGKELIDYADTSETVSMRTDLETINTVINGSRIRYEGVPLPPSAMVRKFTEDRSASTPTFAHHGRLYGGLWQSVPKELRYKLSLDGEPLVDLDYTAMFIQLAYAHLGAPMPKGDPYMIPGLEAYRSTVKKLVSSLFFRDGMASRFPRDIDKLPPPWTMQKFVSAVAVRHKAIASLLGSDIGFRLMYAESEVLVAVLLGLASQGVTALPMHDGLMVAQTHRSAAIAVMKQVSEVKLGRALSVVEKPILRPI